MLVAIGGLLALGCSDGEPVGTDASDVPELAGPPGRCPETPYGTEIDRQFQNKGHRTAVRARCATILRHDEREEIELAAKKTVALCHFEAKHGKPPPGEVCALFLEDLFGIEPAPEAFADGGYIIQFVPPGGGTFVAPNGDFGFGSTGFSDGKGRSLFAFSQVPSGSGSASVGSNASLSSLPAGCLEFSPFPTFEECVDWNLIPNDPFEPGAHFGHCAFFPEEFDPAAFRLAKEFDSPDDAEDGEVFGELGAGIVVLPFEEPPFALSCSGGPYVGEGGPFPPTTDGPAGLRSPGPAAWDGRDASGLLLAGGKGPGTPGIRLAGTSKPIGGTGSSTSDWGVVDVAGGEGEPTLELRNAALDAIVPAGGEARFLLEIGNNGSGDLESVTVVSALDPGLEFSAAEDLCSGCTLDVDSEANTVTVQVPSVAPTDADGDGVFDDDEGFHAVTLITRTPEREGTFCNRASASDEAGRSDDDPACVVTVVEG